MIDSLGAMPDIDEHLHCMQLLNKQSTCVQCPKSDFKGGTTVGENCWLLNFRRLLGYMASPHHHSKASFQYHFPG